MQLLLVYAVTLFIGVLISCLARRSILSVSVLFLAAGFFIGEGWLGKAPSNAHLLYVVSEVALFSVLFNDGMSTGGFKEIREHWHLSGRALLIGMPVTIMGIAALAHWLLGFAWAPSFLLGSVLSPTDPVFASAIFRFEAVPRRVKQILNLESGLNDGLALPAVLIMLDVVAHRSESVWQIVEEMLLGVAIGVVIPWIGIKLEQSRLFGASDIYQRLNAFALGLLVLGVALVLNANLFLAAFAGGITVASVSETVADSFHDFGELVTELLKLAALLIFGAQVAPFVLKPMLGLDYVFGALAFFAVRPLAIELSMVKSHLPQRDILTIGWFGPKGFSSVVYALLVLQVGTALTYNVAKVCGLVIAGSIVIYASTDILIGRLYERTSKKSEPDSEQKAA